MAINLKKNQKIGILIAGLIIIAIIIFFIFKPKANAPSTITSLKGKFTALSDGTPVLQIAYIGPSSFGDNGAVFRGTLIYLIPCLKENCPADIVHPTIDQLTTNLYPQLGVTDGEYVSGSKPQVASGSVTINLSLTSFKPNLIPGSTYKIGVGIANDQLSIFGSTKLPNIYGDFSYITFVYGDGAGPGKIDGLTSKFATI